MTYHVYRWFEEDGHRFALYRGEDGGLQSVKVSPGSTMPVYQTIDADVVDLLINERQHKERPVLEAERTLLAHHRDDAIDTRDRLLAMLERQNARTA